MLIKAEVGQHLLTLAWQQTLKQNIAEDISGLLRIKQVKPWPWADFHPVGQLTFAFANEQVERKPTIVLNSDSGQALAFGPGLHGLSLASDNLTIISGHNDSVFSPLATLSYADTISYQTINGKRQTYHIQSLEVVDLAKQPLMLTDFDTATKPSLLLITCFPFQGRSRQDSSLRYLVYAQAL
ncbi:sortase domain-containing protein [Thalassotalea sp. PLHSN55]|uniref:sortase domain-containing protein n=1 Tax=Thalassotalea sp. PLHSN55 TaxID=3435888 RepID=UPI003F83FA4E